MFSISTGQSQQLSERAFRPPASKPNVISSSCRSLAPVNVPQVRLPPAGDAGHLLDGPNGNIYIYLDLAKCCGPKLVLGCHCFDTGNQLRARLAPWRAHALSGKRSPTLRRRRGPRQRGLPEDTHEVVLTQNLEKLGPSAGVP